MTGRASQDVFYHRYWVAFKPMVSLGQSVCPGNCFLHVLPLSVASGSASVLSSPAENAESQVMMIYFIKVYNTGAVFLEFPCRFTWRINRESLGLVFGSSIVQPSLWPLMSLPQTIMGLVCFPPQALWWRQHAASRGLLPPQRPHEPPSLALLLLLFNFRK